MLSATSSALLARIGLYNVGANAVSRNGVVWLGGDGPYVNDFINASGHEIILVLWSVAGSWVNAIKPLLTVTIPARAAQTVSFANGASGAWAPIYANTEMSQWGQIAETWGEFTFNGSYSTVDVSRQVNMQGHPMTIFGGVCTSDFGRCVFQCKGGVSSCLTGYELFNCEAGSQPGAQIGRYDGADTGGCSGMKDTAKLTTTFH